MATIPQKVRTAPGIPGRQAPAALRGFKGGLPLNRIQGLKRCAFDDLHRVSAFFGHLWSVWDLGGGGGLPLNLLLCLKSFGNLPPRPPHPPGVWGLGVKV